MKEQILFICCMVAVYYLSACNTAPQQVPLKEKNLPKHIILVSFDGLNAYCLSNGADMPTSRRITAEGASTLKNHSIPSSSSACSWASMFMRTGPELHGYTEWGSRAPGLPLRIVSSDDRSPNILGMYRDRVPEAETGRIYEWEDINYLVDTLAMNFRKHAPISAENPNEYTPIAAQYIKEKKPNLYATMYDQPDGTRRGKGWGSPRCFTTVNRLNSCLTQVMDAVRETDIMDDTVVTLMTDHGGIETGHGGKTINEVQTLIIFYGKNVKKGFRISESMMVYGITGTITHLLNVL